MPASFDTVKARVTDVLNLQVPGTFSATIASTNLDRNDQAITEACREGAMMIAKAILANPNHIHRNLFVSATPTTLTHAGELPDMAGDGDLIQIQKYDGGDWETGVPRAVQQIDSFRANPSTLYAALAHTVQNSPLAGYYAIDNGRIKFTGFAARMFHPAITRATVTDVIPDEYEDVWVATGVMLSLKEGDNMQPVAGHYTGLAMAGLQGISMMTLVPMGLRGDV